MVEKRSHLAMMNASPGPDFGQAAPNSMPSIPRYVQYTSPVPNSSTSLDISRAATLPLNLIALIVSHLDDIGDIARVTRTSRLLYYMTLPQLYEHVDLRSYADMRYVNGRPEGFGSGSPFMMGLNGLVTKQHAALVKDLRVHGNWNEIGVDAYAKGRVPDNSMMLNILLRAATDKMSKLQSFSWELDCKPLKTLYQGLGTHNTLTSFTLRFPSTRIPRPSVLIPPMANLRVFKAMDIDPLCHPDDISILMLHSRKLSDVRLHFSPRMRAENESIMTLNMFFGRCHQAGYKLKLKHFAMHNFFGPNVLGMDQIFDLDYNESVTFLDTFGSRDPRTVFVDSTWENVPKGLFYPHFKHIRCNELAPAQVSILRSSKVQLERFYIVNERRKKSGFTRSDTSSSPLTPVVESETPKPDPEVVGLAAEYLDVITRKHGDGLRHLLLSNQWALDRESLADIVRHCPNLEQLGIAVNSPNHDDIRLLMPFLTKMRCLRILNNEHLEEHMRTMTHAERMWHLGREFGRSPPPHLKMAIFGDTCYKLGKTVELTREDGVIETHREILMVDQQEANEFEIWRLDKLDLSVDPTLPFSP